MGCAEFVDAVAERRQPGLSTPAQGDDLPVPGQHITCGVDDLDRSADQQGSVRADRDQGQTGRFAKVGHRWLLTAVTGRGSVSA